MTTYTTGPWNEIVEQVEPDGRISCRILKDGWEIGIWRDAEWDGDCPNARLILTSPELFESLVEMLSLVESLQPVVLGESDRAHNDRQVRARAKAAISKAKGQ
jgi:hypothetical protein